MVLFVAHHHPTSVFSVFLVSIKKRTTEVERANGNEANQRLPTQRTTKSYDKENRMATFAEDATLNTYHSDGFKKDLNVG
jgi:hypothetical protein